eukprot:gene25576-30710_t
MNSVSTGGYSLVKLICGCNHGHEISIANGNAFVSPVRVSSLLVASIWLIGPQNGLPVIRNLDKSPSKCACPRKFQDHGRGFLHTSRQQASSISEAHIMHRYRSHTCAALRKSDVGST